MGKRRFEMAPLSALVPAKLRGSETSWQRLVGATLADSTAMVGLGANGVLRVAARNETARREVLARAPDIIAAFNIVAARLGSRRAESLQCWVSDRFYLPGRPRRAGVSRRRQPAEPGPEALARARDEITALAGDAPAAVLRALIRARARSYGAARRSDET